MSAQLVKEVVDASGSRRVRFYRTGQGAFCFQEERYWDAAPEDEGHAWGWQEAGRRSGLFADMAAAETEAAADIGWLGKSRGA